MDLSTTYLGLKLRNPLVVGASPFCDQVATAHALEDAGAAAVVMRSLFEEQFDPGDVPSPLDAGPVAPAETDAVPADFSEYVLTPEQYLRQLALLKRSLKIPVIASLNAARPGSWLDFARRMEAAGADAIELNLYRVVTDPELSAESVNLEMVHAVATVAGGVRIPVAVKLSPFHSAVVQLAIALELAGAAGMVLFNRFYQSDISLADLTVRPVLRLSNPSELLLRLRWLAILSPHLRGSLAATGGIHSSGDMVKALLAGAHAVQLVSILLREGPRYVTILLQGLTRWMKDQGYASLHEFRGRLNLSRCPDPAALERANYVRTLQLWRS